MKMLLKRLKIGTSGLAALGLMALASSSAGSNSETTRSQSQGRSPIGAAFMPPPVFFMYHDVIPDAPPVPVPGEKRQIGTADITVTQFRDQMSYLKSKGYQTISIDEYREAKAQGKPIPANAVVITFDDGYEGNFRRAVPILKDHGFKATFFLTQYMRGPDPENRADPATALDYIEDPHHLGTYHLKQYHSHMSVEEIKAMAGEVGEDGKPLFGFGAHTLTHGDLSKMKDDKARAEMKGSKELIEGKLAQFGIHVKYLAYPEGRYSPKTVEIASELDVDGKPLFEAAFAVGLKEQVDPNYAIPRLPITHSTSGELRDLHGQAMDTTTLSGFKEALEFWKTYRPHWEANEPDRRSRNQVTDSGRATSFYSISQRCSESSSLSDEEVLPPNFKHFHQEIQNVLWHLTSNF